MSEPVVVVATIVAKPGEEAAVEKAVATAQEAVHAEPGCLLYAFHRNLGKPGEYIMVEKWESQEALGVHGKGQALRELGKALADILAAPLDVQVLAPVPNGDAGLGAL
ncbi:putative quinol monooxygenase [Nocardia sp. alder85J]|uniref:putative quinol monooxygenase n=1 Tax=Nocardia sp. alder85J TaxID=2862949 RepID=UPI001CD506BC|nr:putative quinol monooxygenase [Nocardia sp. alder85J]MCX4098244.1 putative quinol monooxygenase [Nocardia sp. alder85J]